MGKNPDYNKENRMRTKIGICMAAIITLFVVEGIFWLQGIRLDVNEEVQPAPVVEILKNVYVTEVTDTYIGIFDGENKNIPYITDIQCLPGQIVDMTLIDGVAGALTVKDADKRNGKVLGVEPGVGIKLENGEKFSFAEDVKFYMLYGELRLGTVRDIRIGYDFADFVIEDGKICAVLLVKEETMEYIRVQIKNSDYAGGFHESVVLTCDTDFVVRIGGTKMSENGDLNGSVAETVTGEVNAGVVEELHTAGESITITADSGYFTDTEAGKRLIIVPTVLTGKISLQNVNRSQGVPSYRGIMEILLTDNGLAVINEVLLEEYLYAVVPSEMPSGYPLEALKAQAICARTYAYSHMMNPGLPQIGAHVDDSTAYQVYNNILEQNTTTTAVKETAGQLLYAEGNPVSTFYYSTSCGFGSDEHAWKSETASELSYLSAQSISRDNAEGKESIYTAQTMKEEAMFAQFLDYPPETDFEKAEPWYRWRYDVTALSSDRLLSQLQSRFGANEKLILTLEDGVYISKEPEKLGSIQNISVLVRNEGGAADEVLITGTEATYKVISELNIRYVLCDGITQVVRQDGSRVDMQSLLPSAFFIITPVKIGENMVGYQLYGGGFGHGAGMSQNGAKNMAEAGFDATEILAFFYKNSVIEKVE